MSNHISNFNFVCDLDRFIPDDRRSFPNKGQIGRLVWECDVVVTNDILHSLKNESFIPLRGFDFNSYPQSIETLKIGDTFSFEMTFPMSGDDSYEWFCEDRKSFKETVIQYDGFFPIQAYCFNEKEILSFENSWLISYKNNVDRIKLILDSLKCLAHYVGGNELIFIDSSEQFRGSVVLSASLADVSERVFDLDLDGEFLKYLKNEIESESINYLKERSVFRTTLFEFFKNKGMADSKTNLNILLENISVLDKMFSLNFEAYIQGMTVDKLKIELGREQAKFAEQVVKGIGDLSTKMLTLPAVWAIFSLIKNDKLDFTVTYNLTLIVVLVLLISMFFQARQLFAIKSSSDLVFDNLIEKFNKISNNEGVEQNGNSINDIRKKITNSSYCVALVIWIYFLIVYFGTAIFFDYSIDSNFKIFKISFVIFFLVYFYYCCKHYFEPLKKLWSALSGLFHILLADLISLKNKIESFFGAK